MLFRKDPSDLGRQILSDLRSAAFFRSLWIEPTLGLEHSDDEAVWHPSDLDVVVGCEAFQVGVNTASGNTELSRDPLGLDTTAAEYTTHAIVFGSGSSETPNEDPNSDSQALSMVWR